MFFIINVKFELYSTFSEKHVNLLNDFLKAKHMNVNGPVVCGYAEG